MLHIIPKETQLRAMKNNYVHIKFITHKMKIRWKFLDVGQLLYNLPPSLSPSSFLYLCQSLRPTHPKHDPHLLTVSFYRWGWRLCWRRLTRTATTSSTSTSWQTGSSCRVSINTFCIFFLKLLFSYYWNCKFPIKYNINKEKRKKLILNSHVLRNKVAGAKERLVLAQVKPRG